MLPSEEWDAIQIVKCEFESYSGKEIEGLMAKVFRDVDLVQMNTLRIVKPYPANVGFRPRTLTVVERCRFKTHFLSELAGKCTLVGAGCKSWLGSTSWHWSASSGIFGAELCKSPD